MDIKILSQNIYNNISDFTPEIIEKLFSDYAKQEVLSELENLYSLGCHSEYLRESIKESIDEIKNLRLI